MVCILPVKFHFQEDYHFQILQLERRKLAQNLLFKKLCLLLPQTLEEALVVEAQMLLLLATF
jgi:hypothetical protein